MAPIKKAWVSKEQARLFSAAYNRGDMDECDRIARAVTGREDARGGEQVAQRWDHDAVLNTAQAYDFLSGL